MKPLLLTLLCLAAGETITIAQDTVYFDKIWHETTPKSAAYYRLKTRNGAGWQVSDHWLNGKTQMTGSYADDSCKIYQGEFIWYDTTGNPNHRCMYDKGKLNGPEAYFYPNGHLKMTGTNKNGEMDGGWVGYYPSGKISGKANYKGGKQIVGTFYEENGAPNKDVKEFYRESEYPGGVNRWLYFLNKNLRYPDSAYVYEIQGTVIIDFIISKEGRPHNFHVSQSVNPYLDAEALRVARAMPDWIPAIYAGIPSESYKRQPIVFQLQAQ